MATQEPSTPVSPMDPTNPEIDVSPLYTPEPTADEEPLYTEINIPLPPVPKAPTPPASLSPPKVRHRAHSLSSLSPFSKRRESSPPAMIEKQLENEKEVKESKRVSVMKTLGRTTRNRSGTLDAAIVPAVMVLKAELFTPEDKKKAGKDAS